MQTLNRPGQARTSARPDTKSRQRTGRIDKRPDHHHRQQDKNVKLSASAAIKSHQRASANAYARAARIDMVGVHENKQPTMLFGNNCSLDDGRRRRQRHRMFASNIFAEKVVLVTGGGTGIGLDVALRFATLGARVVICGRREAKLREAVVALGPAAAFSVCDIRQSEHCIRVIGEVVQRFGRLDILVNNAGCVRAGARKACRVRGATTRRAQRTVSVVGREHLAQGLCGSRQQQPARQ